LREIKDVLEKFERGLREILEAPDRLREKSPWQNFRRVTREVREFSEEF